MEIEKEGEMDPVDCLDHTSLSLSLSFLLLWVLLFGPGIGWRREGNYTQTVSFLWDSLSLIWNCSDTQSACMRSHN